MVWLIRIVGLLLLVGFLVIEPAPTAAQTSCPTPQVSRTTVRFSRQYPLQAIYIRNVPKAGCSAISVNTQILTNAGPAGFNLRQAGSLSVDQNQMTAAVIEYTGSSTSRVTGGGLIQAGSAQFGLTLIFEP